MKKFLAMILALVMALSLVACGKKDEPKTDDQNHSKKLFHVLILPS